MVAIPFVIYLIFMGIFIYNIYRRNKHKNMMTSSDGHVVKDEENLTCENEHGHIHPLNNEFGPRYIVHNEPEDGYIVLNGVLRKIEDCKDL